MVAIFCMDDCHCGYEQKIFFKTMSGFNLLRYHCWKISKFWIGATELFFPKKLNIFYVICQPWVLGTICKWGTHKNNTRNMCTII